MACQFACVASLLGCAIIVLGILAVVCLVKRWRALPFKIDGPATVVAVNMPRTAVLWEAHPKEMATAMRIYIGIVETLVKKYKGVLMESCNEVESLYIAFGDMHNAPAFSAELQFAMLKADWPEAIVADQQCPTVTDTVGNVLFRGPRARCGIHRTTEACTPQTLPQACGNARAIARRVAMSGAAGQILITETVYREVVAMLEGWSWQYLGEYVYEEVAEEVGLYSIVPSGLHNRNFGVLRYRKQLLGLSDGSSFFSTPSDVTKSDAGSTLQPDASCTWEEVVAARTAMQAITGWVERSGDAVSPKEFLALLDASQADAGCPDADVVEIRRHVARVVSVCPTPHERDVGDGEFTDIRGDASPPSPRGLRLTHLTDIFAMMSLDMFYAFGIRVQQLAPAEPQSRAESAFASRTTAPSCTGDEAC